MLANIKKRHTADLLLVENIYDYHKNLAGFTSRVESLDRHAMRAYVILLIHYSEELLEIPSDLHIFTPEKLFECLIGGKHLLENDRILCTYIVDLVEILVQINDMHENSVFYSTCTAYLDVALENGDLHVVSVFLQIFHRLDQVLSTGLPEEILLKIVEVAHNTQRSTEQIEAFFTEGLLLLDSSLHKQHNQKNGKAGNVLRFIWNDLCPSNIMKHQCDNCYTIISQLIDAYLVECTANEEFRCAFLTQELWSFIRVAIESKTLKSRKQAIFMLQNILQTDSLEEIKAITTIPRYTDDQQPFEVNYSDIWSHYFVILETLLEVQFKLIVSCLNEYLESIVKYIPPFWCNILFTQILQHHNNYIIHVGIEFILRHSISLQHDGNLMMVLFTALNNTYLYTEVDFNVDEVAKYLQTMDLNTVLEIMGKINWQSVPVWTLTQTLAKLFKITHGEGVNSSLLFNFLKCSLAQIKTMPSATELISDILNEMKASSTRFTLDNLMVLYEATKSDDIVKHADECLNYNTFENNFIQLDNVSIRTKIVFFQQMIPDVKDQLQFLDGFYEKNKSKIRFYPDYEFLLFNSICAQKTLYSAMLVLKPRLYNLLKVDGAITVDSLHLVVSLLAFIVDKHLRGDNKNITTYESIKKITYNFYDTFREKVFTGKDSKKTEAIHTKLIIIDSKLSACNAFYPNSMEVLGILHDAALIEKHVIELDRFNKDDEKDVKSIQGLYDCFMKEADQLRPAHQAAVVER